MGKLANLFNPLLLDNLGTKVFKVKESQKNPKWIAYSKLPDQHLYHPVGFHNMEYYSLAEWEENLIWHNRQQLEERIKESQLKKPSVRFKIKKLTKLRLCWLILTETRFTF